jgi:long-chain fatty acid transport protein
MLLTFDTVLVFRSRSECIQCQTQNYVNKKERRKREMKIMCRRSRLLSALLVFSITHVSLAGGLYLNEFATPSMGTASAGAEAVATDASTAFHNPAGMTRLDGNQFMFGAGAGYSSVHFDRATDTPESGGSGGDAGGWVPLSSTHYVHGLSENWRFGFSMYTLSGALLDYDNDWTGRYQCQDVTIMTLSLIPTLAYKLSDELSVAGGFGAVYGNMELDVAIDRPLNLPDGKAEIDGDDWEYAWNLGVLYEMSEQTRLGVGYWSKVDLSFGGDLKIYPIGAQVGTDTDLPLPQFVRGGVYHDLNDKWALLGTVAWENWSELDNVNISTSNVSGALPRNWDDVWHYAFGVHYKAAEKWLYQAGIAYDTSPVSSTYRTADMPVDEQWRYAVGAKYQWSKTFTIGGALEYADLGSGKINGSTLKGDYDRNNMVFAAVHANCKF